MRVSSALFLTNALTYEPLMAIFKASKEGKYAMKLGYSFVASFQGVVFIAWSAQPDAPDWMYWAVMPFWYFSLAKLWESTDFVLALTPPAEKDSFMVGPDGYCPPRHLTHREPEFLHFELSVEVTCHPYPFGIEGLFTQGWRPGRSFGESVSGIFEMDSSDYSNGTRYHTFDIRSDTDFKRHSMTWQATSVRHYCVENIAAGSKRRLGRMTPDAATLTYVSLNALAAVFDNSYMAGGGVENKHTRPTLNLLLLLLPLLLSASV
jgi:hypothetical protein